MKFCVLVHERVYENVRMYLDVEFEIKGIAKIR